MTTHIIYLAAVFLVIVAFVWTRKPLYIAMTAGIIASVILFRIPPLEAVRILAKQTISWDTIEVVLSFYLIMFIQLMMEDRGRLARANASFNALIRNRRMNTMIPPAIMGLLPSAAVMTICADMVDKTVGDSLDNKSKTFVACFYRHIPEMFLPTFPAVLLGLTLGKVNTAIYIAAMIPMVLLACVIVYAAYVRKVPDDLLAVEGRVDKKKELLSLLRNLWMLIAVLVIIIAGNTTIVIASPIVIVLGIFIERFTPKELGSLAIRSVEPVMLGNMYLIMLFKGILSFTGVMTELPVFFSGLPISLTLSFALLFFVGTVISGSQAMIALCMPMACAAFPEHFLPVFVMVMSIAWAAMQISPTHVCSFVAAEYYHTTIMDIVVKGLVSVVLFSILAYGYGMLLGLVF